MFCWGEFFHKTAHYSGSAIACPTAGNVNYFPQQHVVHTWLSLRLRDYFRCLIYLFPWSVLPPIHQSIPYILHYFFPFLGHFEWEGPYGLSRTAVWGRPWLQGSYHHSEWFVFILTKEKCGASWRILESSNEVGTTTSKNGMQAFWWVQIFSLSPHTW